MMFAARSGVVTSLSVAAVLLWDGPSYTQINVSAIPVNAQANQPDMVATGSGSITMGAEKHVISFRVVRSLNQVSGHFEYVVTRPGACAQERPSPTATPCIAREFFETNSVSAATFASRTVGFSGAGNWNRRPGYTFEAVGMNQGTPAQRRDLFSLLVKDDKGNAVAQVTGTVAGSIQVRPLPR